MAALYLFRKRSVLIEEAKQEIVLVNSKDSDFVHSIKKKALDYEMKPKGENMWLVAKEPGSSGVVGLANCLRHESGGSHIRCIFDAGSTGTNKVADFGARMPEYKDVIEKDLVMNIYHNGQWGCYRHVVTKSSTSRKSTQFAVLDFRKRGDLSSLDWYESPLPYCTLPTTKSVDDPIVCDVHFAAVNHRDVMLAKGQLPPQELVGARDVLLPESSLGQEFSGTDQTGRRVMGLVSSQALATAVAADPILLWEVPDSWTLTEASTVPLAYSTAYYALLVRGNTRPGESVLVHGGSGCFGQAAIAVALSMGCTVFASVGSAKEKQFLKDHFPQLEDRHIVNYSDVWLEEHILGQTKQRGVDIVFDGLHGGNTDVAACCLAPNGRYLFIDAVGNSSLGPHRESYSKRKVANNVIAIPIDALHMKDPCIMEEKRRVAGLLLEGIASGTVKPLPFTVYSQEQVLQAFTPEVYEETTNKVVLQVRPGKGDQIGESPSSFTVEAIARTYFYRHKAYIVVGEASTFALEFVNWIVTRGCRNILLADSRGTFTSYQRLCLHRWRTAGASVVVSEADVSTAQGALRVIREAEAMGPVGGIFNVSVVSQRHARLDNRATEQNKASYKTKADGTRHLDEHSRKLCPQLDHFVVFSSVCSGRGTSGMYMRGYVDSALERLCERRAAAGLPGLAIQWGPIYEDSTSSEAQCTQAALEGAEPQKIRSCLGVMERFLNQSHPVVSSLVKAEVNSSSEKEPENHLVDSVTRILGFQESSTLNPNSNLGDLGLDSIMGTQIVTVIEKFTGLALSVHGIRELTLTNLRDMTKEERVK
ncbi:hypothetical protein HPB50_024336 [Hyalomma asiaticum]|uniref:Uncharacterized protein n=1 Tax=Hyalomma asiaticum TaxID=266040 RepID=A0ACB7TBQ4_HYAAI|nr:hypothetical protein HPB50_024336 [Hyalomma asiaticum]